MLVTALSDIIIRLKTNSAMTTLTTWPYHSSEMLTGWTIPAYCTIEQNVYCIYKIIFKSTKSFLKFDHSKYCSINI